jgi:curved DNA-binding protein CbpA
VTVNYYTILGIPPTATDREIKLAFKRLAIQYHPDKHQGNEHFTEQFKIVNEAYQVLSDPTKRAFHDLRLQYAREHARILQAQREEQARYAQSREPASVSERHYRSIPKQRRFSRRDYLIVAALFAFIILFSLTVRYVMNHVTAQSRYNTALPFIERGQWASAHSNLTEAIQMRSDFTDAYLRRASIEMNIYQNYAAAISDFEAAIAHADSVSPHTYYLKGKCHFQLKQYGRAEQELTRALEGDPNLTLAVFERGEIRLFFLRKFEPAIADFTSFLASEPEDELRHDAFMYRGYGHFQLQEYQTAIDDYQQALQTEGHSGRLQYLLGKAWLAVDNRRNACLAFVKAYNLGFSNAEAELWRECTGE